MGLHTLHHLMTIESHLTTQQKEDAWFLLGREEIPDLYANILYVPNFTIRTEMLQSAWQLFWKVIHKRYPGSAETTNK